MAEPQNDAFELTHCGVGVKAETSKLAQYGKFRCVIIAIDHDIEALGRVDGEEAFVTLRVSPRPVLQPVLQQQPQREQ